MILKEPITILANGEFPKHPTPLKILKESNSIICLDGAINNLENTHIKANLIIGDLDSIDSSLLKKYHKIILEKKNQNENDFRKALNWIKEKKCSNINILGATGLRDDHSIANIFSIVELDFKFEMKIFTDYGIFQIVKSKTLITSFKGQPVSLFATKKNIKITTSGLKYPLNSESLNSIYCGTLNESLCDSFTIECNGGSTLVYTAYQK
ncbi:MAG: thiamine diphosphokinase [Candidatus Marinimicrobia bacterium]|nr:thiamine diphosphokinase [Candidatus Neomarinimicrobiota bacterium]|tara:strand:+ start:1908 stop:2537 length:630 start_codon:yes stop_codon:yes gene_type:complete